MQRYHIHYPESNLLLSCHIADRKEEPLRVPLSVDVVLQHQLVHVRLDHESLE
jgi:hypothetical protein